MEHFPDVYTVNIPSIPLFKFPASCIATLGVGWSCDVVHSLIHHL